MKYMDRQRRPVRVAFVKTHHDFGIEQSIRRAVASGLGLREIRKIVEETSIRIVIDNEGGNLQRAAKVLNVTDRTLQKRRADQIKRLEAVVNK
jgi:transcriptional regulator with PAS, ATPase and Fis domain